MQHIKNIEIKNFKSIRHQKIEDCRRINVFIGYPNVGKSNILEALGLFSINDPNDDFGSFIRSENLTTLFYDGNINEQLEIKINDKHRYIGKFNTNKIIFSQQFEREGTSFDKNDTQSILHNRADVSIKKKFEIRQDKKKLFEYNSSTIGTQNELSETKKYEFLKQVTYLVEGYSSLSHPYGNNIFNIVSTNSILKKDVFRII